LPEPQLKKPCPIFMNINGILQTNICLILNLNSRSVHFLENCRNPRTNGRSAHLNDRHHGEGAAPYVAYRCYENRFKLIVLLVDQLCNEIGL